MGYRVHRENDSNKFKVVSVNGTAVEDIITGLTENKARDFSKSLNFGGGFDGKIPEFFLKRFEVSV